MAFAGQAASLAPRESNGLENIKNRVSGAVERVGTLQERLRSFADRVGGSEPADASAKTNPRPVPNGSINDLALSLEDLSRMIEDCHGIAVRIERIG